MPTVEDRIQISAPAEEVWSTVRDFGAIDEYVPSIARTELSGEGVGATRTLTLEDGTEVVERLDALDEETQVLRYSIVESPLPIEDYEGLLSVQSAGNGACEVRWASTFEADDEVSEEMTGLFEALYAAGLEGLRERHASAEV